MNDLSEVEILENERLLAVEARVRDGSEANWRKYHDACRRLVEAKGRQQRSENASENTIQKKVMLRSAFDSLSPSEKSQFLKSGVTLTDS